MKKEPIYLLHHELKWSVFKELQEKAAPIKGIAPDNFDRILWELLRDKRLYLWFDPSVVGDMGMGLEVPEDREVIVLRNGSKAL